MRARPLQVRADGKKEFEEFRELQEFRMRYVGAVPGLALKLILVSLHTSAAGRA